MLQKIKAPSTLENYEIIRKEANEKWWRYTNEAYGYLWFEKEVKQPRKQKDCKNVKQFTEFIEYYKANITTNWAYVSTLWRKYDIILEKNKHSKIMDNLKLYKLHLETHKSKPPCQPSTYLNGNRFLEQWEIIKTTQSTKWMDDLIKQRGYSKDEIDSILLEVKAWEQKHNKEITTWVFDNIAHYAITWEIPQ